MLAIELPSVITGHKLVISLVLGAMRLSNQLDRSCLIAILNEEGESVTLSPKNVC